MTESNSKAPQTTKVALISALIGAAASIAVAFISIVPQLRQADTKKIDNLTAELISLKKSVDEVKVLSRAGGTSNQNTDTLAPHIQLGLSQTETKFSQDQLVTKGKEALNRSGFTGVGINDQVIYGFAKEYTGLVWGPSPNLIVFVVSGPDSQLADQKVQNLKRGF